MLYSGGAARIRGVRQERVYIGVGWGGGEQGGGVSSVPGTEGEWEADEEEEEVDPMSAVLY